MALIAPGGRPGPSAPSDQVTSDQVQGLWLIYDWQSDSDPRYLYTFWPPRFSEYCSVIGREDGSARSGISADPELLIGQTDSPGWAQYLVREYEQESVILRTNLPGKSIKVSLLNLARA